MSTWKAVTVSVECHQRLRALHDRIEATDPNALPPTLRALLPRGLSLSSIVSASVELMEQTLDEAEEKKA